MGSYSSSISQATDNRLAVTDNALGVSSSGQGNNTALTGHILNINASRNGGTGMKGVGGSPDGQSSVNVSVLDGGAIDKSFDFAAFSLSEVLGAIVGSNKQTSQDLASAQVSTMQTIGQAIQSAGTVTAEAAQAAADTAADTSKKMMLIAAGAFGVYYFFFRGKK